MGSSHFYITDLRESPWALEGTWKGQSSLLQDQLWEGCECPQRAALLFGCEFYILYIVIHLAKTKTILTFKLQWRLHEHRAHVDMVHHSDCNNQWLRLYCHLNCIMRIRSPSQMPQLTLIVNLAHPRVTCEGRISWRIIQIIFACGHVFGGLSWWFIDVGGNNPWWALKFPCVGGYGIHNKVS